MFTRPNCAERGPAGLARWAGCITMYHVLFEEVTVCHIVVQAFVHATTGGRADMQAGDTCRYAHGVKELRGGMSTMCGPQRREDFSCLKS